MDKSLQLNDQENLKFFEKFIPKFELHQWYRNDFRKHPDSRDFYRSYSHKISYSPTSNGNPAPSSLSQRRNWSLKQVLNMNHSNQFSSYYAMDQYPDM